jgi:hypothetical protein
MREMKKSESILIVSGLPRSGTSMMMAMLQAGGLSLLIDGARKADEDNPRGYFELKEAKELRKDVSWLPKAKGKVVKVISAQLEYLPRENDYQIIFMNRNLEEVLASQRKMLVRRGKKEPNSAEDKKMKAFFQKHLKKIRSWLKKQPNIKVLEIDHRETINHPLEAAERINQFLGGQLKVGEMARVVDKKLYHQRA